MKLSVSLWDVIIVAGVAAAISEYVDDWLAGACVVTLWLGYKLLSMGDRIPILFLAFAFQWMQVTLGVFYAPLFDRTLITMLESDYRPMVMIGLGCVLAVACGLRAGVMGMRRLSPPRDDNLLLMPFSWPLLLVLYAGTILIEGTLVRYQSQFNSLRQIFVSATVVRYVLLFFILRRLTYPRFQWPGFALLLGTEVVLGFTMYFAAFREPLVLGVIAMFEVFDRRRVQHWVALVTLAAVMAVAGVVWMGVRETYRKEFDTIDSFATSSTTRLNRMSELSGGFLKQNPHGMLAAVDQMVDRVWAVYYPALAVSRVPRVLPHSGGTIFSAAVQHALTPRVFFPEKAEMASDSDMVRKYSGVWVAGREEGTTIAFGYAAESYVDFGIPAMFIPIFGFGVLMGVVYAWLLNAIRFRDLGVALVTVIFWLSLYLFERSWANTLGYALSMVAYLGVPLVILDRLFFSGPPVRSALARDEAFEPLP